MIKILKFYQTLAILLQLSFSTNSSNIIVSLNQFFAFTTISIIIFQLYQQYNILNIHQILANNQQFSDQQGMYKLKKRSFYYFIKILILKINMDFIINFLDQQVKFFIFFKWLIIIILLLSKQLYVLDLVHQEQFFYFIKIHMKKKKIFYLNMISNLSISSIFFIVIVFAINDQKNIKFIDKNKDVFGWLIISLVLLAIFVELCSLTIELILHFYFIFKKIKKKFLKYFIKTNTINQSQKNETIQKTVNCSNIKKYQSYFQIVLF
ncbi:unnamed protein product [Paramecium pentaurelia]|uniref:Transmembrane protein n=1 Tax=Paramecium pentaurelia TaxID=43138 RepID=A0A8S1VER9_9CILI|nr:unnamed protein product [Paramecium pentaurelia]